MQGINVCSEISPLKKVLLHCPGNELLNLTPDKLKELLFDDIPYLKVAQKEHNVFAKTLKDMGVEVVYLEDLMCETLDQNPEIIDQFIKQFIIEANINSKKYTELVFNYLKTNCKDTKSLVLKTMEGMRLSELPKSEVNTLVDHLENYYETMLLAPLPNLYFQRDPFASIGQGVVINKMYSITRSRETIYADYIFKYHSEYKDTKRYYSRNFVDSVEGGDILNFNQETIAIGISQRTSPDAIEKIAHEVFNDETSKINTIYAISIPVSRAFMHLDTVFTQVDYDKFTYHPAILGNLKVFKITKGTDGESLNISESSESLRHILAMALKLRDVDLIPCGGKDMIAAAREQWNDGTNTLCIKPATVIAYERNEITNAVLRKHDIEVIEIPSSELSRGRGGPRCMSMPLWRNQD